MNSPLSGLVGEAPITRRLRPDYILIPIGNPRVGKRGTMNLDETKKLIEGELRMRPEPDLSEVR